MYVKQPSLNTSHIKLPENYSGNAFSPKSYSDMPPPARQSLPKTDPLPKSSPLAREIKEARDPAESDKENDMGIGSEDYLVSDEHVTHPPYEEHSEPQTTPEPVKQEHESSSIFSSLIPKLSASNNFPFGHGIGGEELLILAMMLLIYLSGYENNETDNEFMLLLGLLLFAG